MNLEATTSDKPKSRLGMIQSKIDESMNDLSESKDFEKFYQRSLLPKELQKVNPALLNIHGATGTPLRSLSPISREVTEEEKDLIRLKYKLKYCLCYYNFSFRKMNTKLMDDRK